MFLQLQELVIIFMLIPSVALVILVTQGGVYQPAWVFCHRAVLVQSHGARG